MGHFLALTVCVFSDSDVAKVKSNIPFFTVAISSPPTALFATAVVGRSIRADLMTINLAPFRPE
jgi:hypothetical protein